MGDERMSGHEARQRMSWGAGIAIGMATGVALGSALGNMGAGIAIGIAVGVVLVLAFGAAGRRRSAGDDPGRSGETDGPDGDEPDAER